MIYSFRLLPQQWLVPSPAVLARYRNQFPFGRANPGIRRSGRQGAGVPAFRDQLRKVVR
jgi:hypothetical protein